MSEIILKPCPFCGREAVFEEVEARVAGSVMWSVGCIQPEDFIPGKSSVCPGWQTKSLENTKKEAANAWNRRGALEADVVWHSTFVRVCIERDDLTQQRHFLLEAIKAVGGDELLTIVTIALQKKLATLEAAEGRVQ